MKHNHTNHTKRIKHVLDVITISVVSAYIECVPALLEVSYVCVYMANLLSKRIVAPLFTEGNRPLVLHTSTHL
jgi:hypothetical protein